MSVQFIVGRAGSGKTARFFQQTIAACRVDPLGAPIWWIVPRQATFQIERDLCCGADLSGFFRVRVAAFELLCRDVLGESGGAAAPEVTPMGRRMILGHLLRQHQDSLRFLGPVAARGGLAAELDATLDDLDRGGADLSTLVAKLPDPANTALADKAHDLQLISAAYDEFLGEHRLDPQRRLQQAMEAFDRSALLANATIFVDGFLRFSHRERQMLTALARVCSSMQIALTLDPASVVLADVHQLPDDLSLFHRMEIEYRKLHFAFQQSGIKSADTVVLGETHRFQSPDLGQIEQWSAPTGPTPGEGLELIEAPDHRAEVAIAARRVRDLVAGGYRYRDILVLARQLGDYQDLISAAFAEHGIPFFLDDRRPAAHHPMIQFLGAALEIAAGEGAWPMEPLRLLIKTGLCGLTADEADELENDLLVQGSVTESVNPLLARILDPLRPFIASIAGPRSARQLSQAVFALLEKFQVRQTLAQWIANSTPEQAAEHQQVWTELCDLFQQLVDFLGPRPMPLEEFRAVLDGALETFDLAIAPATIDQVLVGQVDRTRPPAVKAAIVLGLSNGQFPLPPPVQTILTDADRRSLAGLADVEPDTRRRALDEEFLGYFAFTRASRRLIITRPMADESGRALEASSLWRKLHSFAPDAAVIQAPRPDDPQPVDIATPRQLLSGLMQWARRDTADEPHWPALYQWLSAQSSTGVNLRSDLVWPALAYRNQSQLSPALAGQLFPAPLRATPRQLEAFSACPFQHFARYGLNLKARPTHEITGGDVYRLCHDVLTARLDWCDLPPGELADNLRHVAQRVLSKMISRRTLSAARLGHLLDRVQTALTAVIATQRAVLARGDFHPALANVRYGEDGDLPPPRVSEQLILSGTIDRVDVSADDRLAIIHDYRLSITPLPLAEVYHGLNLTLITHLLAWQDAKPSQPIAALASALLRKLRDELPDKAPAPTDEKFDLLVKSRGLVHERHLLDIDRSLHPAQQSEVIQAYLTREATIGYRDSSDVAAPAEFAALLSHVREKLAAVAAQILAGDVAIHPYRLGNKSPCSQCAFHDVCRFVPSEKYHTLAPMKREYVLQALVKERG